jgi:hypothetical protein
LFVHRVLIAVAIALSALLLGRGILAYRAHGDLGALLTGVFAAVAGTGLAFYLRWMGRRTGPR